MIVKFDDHVIRCGVLAGRSTLLTDGKTAKLIGGLGIQKFQALET